jgi:ABC-type uncharacterized transport system involved in gliding motility auxiliary subunit
LNEVANRDLFINAVNWLAEEDDLISIRPKETLNRHIFLTPAQHTLTILSTLVIMPILIFMAGVAVWWNRR